jgi:small-conductance mechanosensitive channel
MSVKELTLDLVVRYGFQVVGAIVILVAGFFLARWTGKVTERWLQPRVTEPPVRTLIVRAVRILVLVPNRRIVGEILHNFGVVRQLQLTVDVAYGTNLTKVLALAREIIEQSPWALKEPAPVIGVSALGASGITLAIQPWVAVTDYVAAKAEFYQTIVDRFRADEIQIPFPQYEVRFLNEAGLEPAARS